MVESDQKGGIKFVGFAVSYRSRLANAMFKRSTFATKSSQLIGDCEMYTDPSKLAADHLRSRVRHWTRLKAAHARELVAAYFGYKSHAALLADDCHPVSNLPEAAILIPDLPLLHERMNQIKQLSCDLPKPIELGETIGEAISDTCFAGEIWLYESIEDYFSDVFLMDKEGRIFDELSGVMAETNAYFDYVDYENAEIIDHGDVLAVSIQGVCSGESDLDRLFYGDTIDMEVQIELYRCASTRGFSDYEMSVSGCIRDDWIDPELLSITPQTAS